MRSSASGLPRVRRRAPRSVCVMWSERLSPGAQDGQEASSGAPRVLGIGKDPSEGCSGASDHCSGHHEQRVELELPASTISSRAKKEAIKLYSFLFASPQVSDSPISATNAVSLKCSAFSSIQRRVRMILELHGGTGDLKHFIRRYSDDAEKFTAPTNGR